jgi:anthranilate synthase component 1
MFVQKLEYVRPLKLYNVLGENKFMLESAKKNGNARYTFLSSNPSALITVDGDGTRVDGKKVSKETNPFKSLKTIFEMKNDYRGFSGGLAGYISYEVVYNYIGGDITEPSVFGLYEDVFIYDHLERRLYYLSNGEVRDAEKIVKKAKREPLDKTKADSQVLGCDADRDQYVEMVEKAKEHIFNGEAFQIVLSREYRIETEMQPLDMYLNLRKINPSPYMFIFEFEEKQIVGSSPETMARVEGNILRVNPIAGTAPRLRGAANKRVRAELLRDEKERAEHVMLVDLARNDVRKVCRAGSVRVESFMQVMNYSHVQHIESEVVGILDERDAFDAIEATFPAGTLTGAPKVRAMEIIEELEMSRRRVYGGCVGYFSYNGSADMAIAIRMVEFDDVARVRAGAGIVADSIPEKEYEETERKMCAVLQALGVQNDHYN